MRLYRIGTKGVSKQSEKVEDIMTFCKAFLAQENRANDPLTKRIESILAEAR